MNKILQRGVYQWSGKILLLSVWDSSEALLPKPSKRLSQSKDSVLEKNQHSVEMAISEGVVEKALQSIDEIDRNTDLLFLCTPVEYNLRFLRDLTEKTFPPITLLTDVGSTKQSIMEEAEALGLSARFCGGHPMAGSESSGYKASDSLLLENAYYLLTPGQGFPTESIEK